MIDVDVQSIGSTIFGGAVCLALARAYVSRLIKAVEELEVSLEKTCKQVSVLEVYIAELTYLKKTLHDHDRKIAALTEASRFQAVCKVRD